MSVILVLTPFCGMQCQIFLPIVGFDIGVSTEASALIEDDFGLSREYILKHFYLVFGTRFFAVCAKSQLTRLVRRLLPRVRIFSTASLSPSYGQACNVKSLLDL